MISVKAPYEHKSDFNKIDKIIRDASGKVIIQPRNP